MSRPRSIPLVFRLALLGGLLHVAVLHATVVFTDSFTVGADANLDAYPSGDPDYAYNVGSGAGLTVEESTDRVDLTLTNTNHAARIIDAGGAITGDQEVAATIAYGQNFQSAEVHVRMAGSGQVRYTGKIEIQNASELRIYKVDSGGTHNILNSADCGLTGAGNKAVTFRATGTTTTALTFTVAGCSALTINDSTSPYTSGVPGIGAWSNDLVDPIWIDNVSVDDLDAGAGSTACKYLLLLGVGGACSD